MRTILSLLLLFCTVSSYGQAKETVAILGDSYSTFEGYLTPNSMEVWYHKASNPQQTDVTSVKQTWWWQVIKEGGYKLGVNNSWSGACICNTGYNDTDATYRSFLTRLGALGTPDIIFIFGGTNDAWAGVPMGEFKYQDIKLADKYSFRPALAYLLNQMTERYPNADIYFISNCDLNETYTQSIHTVCRHYDIPVIQLHDVSKQNGHPDIKGMNTIAKQVLGFLKKK